MSAREYFLQMTDPTNWHADAGPEWAEAMAFVHEGVMEFWDELEENHGSPTNLRLEELERELAEKMEAVQDAANAIDEWRARARRATDSALLWEEQTKALKRELAAERALADRLAARLEACREDSCELKGERDWWKDEPRCGYDKRYAETAANIGAADEAIDAWKEARHE